MFQVFEERSILSQIAYSWVACKCCIEFDVCFASLAFMEFVALVGAISRQPVAAPNAYSGLCSSEQTELSIVCE